MNKIFCGNQNFNIYIEHIENFSFRVFFFLRTFELRVLLFETEFIQPREKIVYTYDNFCYFDWSIEN